MRFYSARYTALNEGTLLFVISKEESNEPNCANTLSVNGKLNYHINNCTTVCMCIV